ncbi:hypothetical protein C5Q98_04265 [Fastidiosipila sanguinis]|uniref:Uncharacterized protein n=2 Tax=Fastidiosipila sanguinis TaxID=236753 RepID=A0A2S0KN73_9FIRM|nr:hypothetical protein C5Q98_04265 [Fastidiosipila sanguinis]
MTMIEENKDIFIDQVEIVSAVAFTQDQKNRLEKVMIAKLPYKELEFFYKVDPDIISGVIINSADFILDSSYRKYMQDLFKEAFADSQYK